VASESKTFGVNPYRWDGGTPKRLVRRGSLLERAKNSALGHGGVLLIMGARGMGKSVFFGDLRRELRSIPGLEVLYFSRPPTPQEGSTLTASELINALLGELHTRAEQVGRGGPEGKLGLELRRLIERQRLREALVRYLDERAEDGVERLVLLYDELDAYADDSRAGRSYFDALEDARKHETTAGRLSVVAAGGLSMLSLATVIGSSFFSRAARHVLAPFGEAEIAELAEPLLARGDVIPDDVLPTLRVLSGGNPLLATYGLESLWPAEHPTVQVLNSAFDDFREERAIFFKTIREPIFGPRNTLLPYTVWRELRRNGGRLTRARLRALQDQAEVLVDSRDVFDMLRASGLVVMNGSVRDDPIVVELVPSVVSLDLSDWADEAAPPASLRSHLREDLVGALGEIQRMTPAFYRPGAGKKEEKQLVPEATFAAGIALVLNSRGWRTELEAMSGAGRTDIKARRGHSDGAEAIIEVKIWGRNDYKRIHEQVASYFARGVAALATVMVTDHKDADWAKTYQTECLGATRPVWRPLAPPLEGYFKASSGEQVVEHFLLRLPSRS
jgi:hypothetical protein